MPSAHEYITELAAKGRHYFTTHDARAALGGSPIAVRAALRRLSQRTEISSPYRAFHVILPPEYRSLGCLPAEQFIPHLMQHLKERYYVALLSAAELHGAAHQRPQRFQVMVAKNRRSIDCGKVRVQFVARSDLAKTPVVEMNTPRGTMRVSSREATMLEVVGYADQCGGLDNVANVLAELGESVDPPKLLAAARLCPIAWSQRLGYLLETTEHGKLADALADHVRKHARTVAPLVRAKPLTGAPRAARWKLAINERVEPDL
jgi:predicted transcriptional regulator of viral defense system